MTRLSSTHQLKVASVDDLLGLVPALLHFHPSDSLVVVLVQDGRIELTGRADLPALSDADALDAAFGPVFDRFGRADCFAIAYSADALLAWGVLGALEAVAGPRWLSLLHADGERWFSAPDGVGTPYDPATTAVAAAAAYAGIEVRGSRDELRASLVGTFSEEERLLALAGMAERWGSGDGLEAGGASAIRRFRENPGELGVEERVLLAAMASDAGVAEDIILSTTRHNAENTVALWAQSVQGAPPRLEHGALTVLAVASWVRGDGAMALVCLDRLRELGHEDPWVDFVDLVCAHAVNPDCWDEIRADFLSLPEGLTP